jgi:hypothetical protein
LRILRSHRVFSLDGITQKTSGPPSRFRGYDRPRNAPLPRAALRLIAGTPRIGFQA